MLTGAIGMVVDYSMYLRSKMATKWQLAKLDAESDDDSDSDSDSDEEKSTFRKGRQGVKPPSLRSRPPRMKSRQVSSASDQGNRRRGGLIMQSSSLSMANLYNLSAKQRFWVDRVGLPAYAVPIIQELLLSAVLILVNLGVGTLFYSVLVDEFMPVDALYLAAMTVTTVGYGDVAPSNRASRIFTIVYAIFGTLMTAKALATFNSAVEKYKKALEDNAILTSKMTIADLINMDVDQSGRVSKAEYMIYKVIHMNLVDPEVIERIEKQFECIDVNGDGSITVDEIEGTYPKMFVKTRNKSASTAVASHPSRVLPTLVRSTSNASEKSVGTRLKEFSSSIRARFSPRPHVVSSFREADNSRSRRSFWSNDRSVSARSHQNTLRQTEMGSSSQRQTLPDQSNRLMNLESEDDIASLRSFSCDDKESTQSDGRSSRSGSLMNYSRSNSVQTTDSYVQSFDHPSYSFEGLEGDTQTMRSPLHDAAIPTFVPLQEQVIEFLGLGSLDPDDPTGRKTGDADREEKECGANWGSSLHRQVGIVSLEDMVDVP
jgi:hypothetical protein